jgi:ABC-type sulfate transport system substrate-binding protein
VEQSKLNLKMKSKPAGTQQSGSPRHSGTGEMPPSVTDSHIQMVGMEQHARAFITYHYSDKDVMIAKQHSLGDRCVKVHGDGKREALDHEGQTIRVDTFRFCSASNLLGEYRCGLAVQI